VSDAVPGAAGAPDPRALAAHALASMAGPVSGSGLQSRGPRRPERPGSPGSPGRPGPEGPGRPVRPAGPRTGRARRSGGGWAAQLPYVIVLAGLVAGLSWIWQGPQYVRPGTFTVTGALFVAAAARLALPEQRAGMLASRWRYIDVTALAILAVGLLVAGLVLPTPS